MRTTTLALAFSLITWTCSVQAAPLTLSPTPTGLSASIENQGLVADLYSADGQDDTYAIHLVLTTSSGYLDTDDADLLAAFAIDFGSSALDGATLVTSPSGFSWTPALVGNKVPGGSAKCNGSEDGSLCVEEVPTATNNLVLDGDATYSWLFHVDIGESGFSDTTALTLAIATLKKTGPNYQFQSQSIVSAVAGSLGPAPVEYGEPTGPGPDVTPVPEPTTLVLLGSGLLIAARRIRRQ